MLWIDKYRPSDLGSLDYHDNISRRLESLARNPSSLPHLFFYGKSGAGKRTRISSFLVALFGPSANRLKINQRTFTTPTGRTVEIHMINSDFHIEISPGDAGNNDRFVIQDVLKDIASSKNIRTSVANMQEMMGENNPKSNSDNEDSTQENHTGTAAGEADPEIKVVVLHQVDRLTKQAQAALRRTMEKYAATCRLILCCDSPSKLIAPLRSRCLGIRVAAPSENEIAKILKMVSSKEKFHLPNSVAIKIARESNRNLRKALLMLEAAKVQCSGNDGIHENQNLPETDWEIYLKILAADIVKEQSPAMLLAAREKLYELLVNCIPASTILMNLTFELLRNLDDSVKLEVIEWASHYEHRIAIGNKDIFHLEAFVAKFMAIYKKYLNDLFADM